MVYPTHTEPAFPLIYLWLDRSASCPLSLSFAHDDQGEWENDGSESASRVLDLLCTFWQRWRHFCLVLPDPCPGYAITNLPDAGPPLLESLSILIGAGLCAEEVEVAAALYTAAPKLSEFTWGWSYYDIDSRTVPWSQLSYLRLECDVSVHAALNIIKQCTNLITLYLDGVVSTPDGETVYETTDHITHHTMRSLSVGSIQSPDLRTSSTLFKQLTLPNLRYFNLSEVQPRTTQVRPTPPNIHLELSLFFQRSKCPLQSLRVDSVVNILSFVLEVTSVVHNTLIALEIRDDRRIIMDPLVSMLILRPTSASITTPHPLKQAAFCPRLEVLKFGGNIEAHPRLIRSLMLSRWANHRFPTPILHFQSEWPISTGFTRGHTLEHQR
ncbi:hypothetical protein ONZ45_g8982 [Pleurotus djamor]|nr:hypothetical protein ONZ45_g8982 [Pleurotus djamor]